MAFSIPYGIIRARQLEGTYPGDVGRGAWGISYNRVCFGWGRVDEKCWPRFQSGTEQSDFLRAEPEGIDETAKRHRVRFYERVRSAAQCRKIINHNQTYLESFQKKLLKNGRFTEPDQDVPGYLEMKGAFEITRQFVNAPRGIVLLPPPDAVVVGTHAVPLIRDLKSQKAFEFSNSWGEQWGDHGTGRMPYEFFDQWLVEAWATDESAAELPGGRGIQDLTWDVPDLLGDKLHGLEVYDGDSDERIGWAFAVHRDRHLDVEELFVRPDRRGRGHGSRLAERLLGLAQRLGLPPRAWVTFADCAPGNQPALGSILAKLGLGIERSGVYWAAYRATQAALKPQRFPTCQNPCSSGNGKGSGPDV